MNQKYLLQAQDLTRTLHGDIDVTLVRGISLGIPDGKFSAITGPSGSGKSSLLYLLGLLDRPTTGTLKIDGIETTKMSDDDMATLRLEKMGFIFQFHFLLPEFTSLENVMLPMQRLGKMSTSAQKEKAQSLLESVGLKDQINKLPKQMSGGQCQRVAIARALANDPVLIMADEPTGNLDTVSSATVQKILQDIAHQPGRAVVAVTHDMDFAKIADKHFHLVDGRIENVREVRAELPI
jgi:lipoprotein-releasing system ATP-binding protein